MESGFKGKYSLKEVGYRNFLYIPDSEDPLTFYSKEFGIELRMDVIFETDGASTPRFLYCIPGYDPWDWPKCAILHDYLWYCRFSGHLKTNFFESNRILYEALRWEQWNRFIAWTVKHAVNMFGWYHWLKGEKGEVVIEAPLEVPVLIGAAPVSFVPTSEGTVIEVPSDLPRMRFISKRIPMRSLFTLSVFLGLCLVCQATEPKSSKHKILGDQEIPLGGFAMVTIDGSQTVIWSVNPSPIMDTEIAGVLIFTGVGGVDYTVMAVVIDFDKKTAEKLRHKIRFLGGPSPGPSPGPAPPLPGPVPPAPPFDPLLDALQRAVQNDPDKTLIPNLIDFYNSAVNEVDGASTWSGLFVGMSKLAKDKGIAGKLPNVQTAIEVELKSKLPWRSVDVSMTIDDNGKKRAKEAFQRIATVLEKVK